MDPALAAPEPGPPSAGAIVRTARCLADDVLFPKALEIDRSSVIPAAYLDRLAAEGLYGLYGPHQAGGWAAEPEVAARAIEALAGGSLTAAFVWIQHHSALRAVAAARPVIRDHWLAAMCAGRVRAGIALGALRRTGAAAVVATRVEGGWVLAGNAPWVTGWDRIGVVYVGARSGPDIVWVLVDPAGAQTLRPRPVELAAVASSATVTVDFVDHIVPDGRVVAVEPFDDWVERDRTGLQTNGYLALGVAARSTRLLGDAVACSALDAEIDAARRALDGGDVAEVLRARADATLLAVRAASALVVDGGGRSVELDAHAQRLAREAMFLLVFGQTRDIRAAQLATLLPCPGTAG